MVLNYDLLYDLNKKYQIHYELVENNQIKATIKQLLNDKNW